MTERGTRLLDNRDQESTVKRGLAISVLSRSFGHNVVLQNVTFRVERGEFVAVLGPSGAGKTTLIRCLASLLAPDRGEVRLDGVNLHALGGRTRRLARRRVAVVFQQFNLVNRLTALENVLAGRLGYVAAWRGWLRRFRRPDVVCALECLDRVGMLDYADQRADTLSGGQQQRVAIARALAQQPAVILADEPIASLDPQTSADILELLRGIAHRDGVAVLCSLHQTHLAREYADRIVGLTSGCIVLDVAVGQFDAAAADLVYRTAP